MRLRVPACGGCGGIAIAGASIREQSIGGTFEPFSAEELARRYPTREIYVDLVRKAAAHLLAGRYILQEDHDAYIRAAENHRW